MIIGFLIIFTFVYRLVFMERISYQIDENVPNVMIVIVTMIMLSHLVAIITYIKQLRGLPPSRISVILVKVYEFLIYKHLRAAGNYLLKSPLISKATLESGGALLYSIQTTLSLFLVNIPLLLMPKLIIACALLGDVILINQIQEYLQTIPNKDINIEHLQKQLEQSKAEVMTNVTNLNLLQEQKSVLEEELKLSQNQLTELREVNTRLNNELGADKQSISLYQKEVEDLKYQLEGFKNSMEELSKQQQDLALFTKRSKTFENK